jgi:hypothetical protein
LPLGTITGVVAFQYIDITMPAQIHCVVVNVMPFVTTPTAFQGLYLTDTLTACRKV